jgi:hypothetical protein
MDPRYFDALTRRLSHAGSRRRVLTALAVGALGQAVDLSSADRVAASCNGGSGCPPEKPCCIKGKCRKRCGDECCADCFVVVSLLGGPDLEHPVCCESSGGTICEHKKPSPGDDRCCYDDEVCLKGKCCWVGFAGVTNCGGKCCAASACCNNEKCCEKGYVCATKENDAEETCVPANRGCAGDEECFAGEHCLGGKCCSGLRECNDGAGKEFCCSASKYCAFKGQPNAECCPINTSCSTYRGHRVRR